MSASDGVAAATRLTAARCSPAWARRVSASVASLGARRPTWCDGESRRPRARPRPPRAWPRRPRASHAHRGPGHAGRGVPACPIRNRTTARIAIHNMIFVIGGIVAPCMLPTEKSVLRLELIQFENALPKLACYRQPE